MSNLLNGEAGRDAILTQLMALGCDPADADGFADFVAQRAVLLKHLDDIKDPWTQRQKALLQEALLHGAEVLAGAQRQRQNLAKKIDQLRGAKRAHKGYSSVPPARFKKQF